MAYVIYIDTHNLCGYIKLVQLENMDFFPVGFKQFDWEQNFVPFNLV